MESGQFDNPHRAISPYGFLQIRRLSDFAKSSLQDHFSATK